jgi:hypothetical protein
MPTETKLDPFKPQQPQIPGVPASAKGTKETKSVAAQPTNHPAAQSGSVAALSSWGPQAWPVWLRYAVAAVGVAVILGLAWRARFSSARRPALPAPAPVAVAAPAPAKPATTLPIGPGEIGSVSGLERPWSSRRFLFRNPTTSELVPSLALRLPDGALWGISLREPYGSCELDYVTDLSKLAAQFGVRAAHPMVVNPCTGTVYDLSQYTSGPSGLVRGEIVRGTAIRAPFAIEIVERGRSIVALRME